MSRPFLTHSLHSSLAQVSFLCCSFHFLLANVRKLFSGEDVAELLSYNQALTKSAAYFVYVLGIFSLFPSVPP